MQKLSPPQFMSTYGLLNLIAGLYGLVIHKDFLLLAIGLLITVVATLTAFGLRRNTSSARLLGFIVCAFSGLFFMTRVVQGSAFPALALAGLNLVAIAVLIQAGAKQVAEKPENS